VSDTRKAIHWLNAIFSEILGDNIYI